MKSFVKLALIFTLAAFAFSSCSKKNSVGKMIPKNAMVVVHIDVKSLRGKLSWDDIKQTSWYEKAAGDSTINGWKKKLLENPENSGIDLNSGIEFFVAKDPATDGQLVLEGSVKSSADFEQFNKNLDSTASEKKDGDFNVMVFKNESVLTWSDKNFVYLFDAATAKSKLPSMNGLPVQNNMSTLGDKSASLIAYAKNLFSLKSDSSLEKNERFGNLIKETGDIHAWVNTEEIANGSGALGMMGMLKLDVFLKDNISTYTANFDNGKIAITQKGYTGKDFADFLQKYSGGSVNTDMIKTIPSQNVLGVFALNFKPEAIKDLIKLTGMDGMLNSYSSQLGFSLDDFVKANKGDLLFAVTDFNMKRDSMSYNDGGENHVNTFTKPEMNYVFSVSIGDKPSFQKILDAGKKITGQMGVSDTLVAYGQNDKVFSVSNKQHFLNDYLAGNANNKYDFLDKMSGEPIGAFIDLHKILTAIAAENNMKEDTVIFNESLKLWNNVYMKGGQFKDGAVTATTEINFIDQNTNSLKQLNHYFDAIAKVEMAKEEKEKSTMKMGTDSVMMAPLIDSTVK